MNLADLLRTFEKLEATLAHAERHLTRQSEANAALHLSERVMYSPLAAEVSARLVEVRRVLETLRTEDEA